MDLFALSTEGNLVSFHAEIADEQVAVCVDVSALECVSMVVQKDTAGILAWRYGQESEPLIEVPPAHSGELKEIFDAIQDEMHRERAPKEDDQ